MSIDKYPIKFICHYDPMDKIWGWVLPPQNESQLARSGSSWRTPQAAYAFWGVMGKTITIKSHMYHNRGSMHALERRKITNKYEEMTIEALLERWPTFWEQLEQSMVFHKLSEG